MNPLKELINSSRFKNAPEYKQKQMYFNLRKRLYRKVEVTSIKAK
jgi:hypothetical protein